MNSLPSLRKRIDRLDLQLLRLLNRRAQLALRVGRIKRQRRQPVFDPRRERVLLRQIVQANQGPLPKGSIHALFRIILRQSRKLQASTK